MAKESVKARQKKREKIVLKYAKKRESLKKSKSYELLQKLPRDASPVRLRNRCSITGRSRGYMRLFGISRIVFRNMVSQGLIPGVKKASW
ncbi:30S ribosomal protein S14 [Blattabacterium sp. (Cryptocercus kyebangensis)]|uniref:30S ribosomal protein S14 n=1 Tax=Blattabacterium sp. (Cryptocercus kyebangensis) TaxID=298656 RepID=UPI000D7C0B92|nr:30S ribosomal protein S14 [Blattabacterium sp. (Cryptocercus kyebangensis)]AWU43688.1 30S ribosomal protein S14 [Blattabacterium sp. (Cryptocercus kyebangensis)]